MAKLPSVPSRIDTLLRSNTVMSLKELCHKLGGRARSSLFRDLGSLDVIASYTHTGQYHALRATAVFDQDGLWFIHDAGFSIFGTLKNTLAAIINDSEIGITQRELKDLLRVNVQNTLTDLIKSDTVGRKLLPNNIYVYLNAQEHKATDQYQRRAAIYKQGTSATRLPAESVRIEVFVELIRGGNIHVDEMELGLRLRNRGIRIQDTEIEYLLIYYDIKKNRP